MNHMDTKLYLERIGYKGETTPTPELLFKLQKAHLLSVPFENLDIHHKIKLDLTHTYTKVVLQNRGGFCYELNGLFYQLLKGLGYSVKMVSARVYDKDKGYGPEFDHLAIIAAIGADNYLVDVGFGEFAFHPLKIELNSDLADPRGVFRIETFDDTYLVVKKKNAEGSFIPEYLFSEKERQLPEFYEMCEYHQTNPASHFTQKRVCSLPTDEGRLTLTGNTFKITTHAKITERQLENEAEAEQVLYDYFNIKLPIPVEEQAGRP